MAMRETSYPRLLADVGGTNARFGCQFEPGGAIEFVRSFACADFETLWDAIVHYLWIEKLPQPRTGAIGIATPVNGDHVGMTNHHWTFSITALQHCLHLDRLLVLNDFSTLALALPTLGAEDLRSIGGGQAVEGAPIGLIGPGTGLGVASLVPIPGSDQFIAVPGEGGHVTLGSCEPEQAQVIQALHARFGHVSAERALSGPGLENLYLALAQVRNTSVDARSAAEITAAALAGRDAHSADVLSIFCSLLGQVAGNMALTVGARGGVYIGGGIVPRLGEWFAHSDFRSSFESKGRFTRYLRSIPTFVLNVSSDAALRGASCALDSEAVGTPMLADASESPVASRAS